MINLEIVKEKKLIKQKKEITVKTDDHLNEFIGFDRTKDYGKSSPDINSNRLVIRLESV